MSFNYKENHKDETRLSAFSSDTLEEKVRFSFQYASVHRKYCLSKSKSLKTDIKGLYNCIALKEKFTWSDFLKGKKNGGIQKETGDSLKLLQTQCPKLKHFGHLYINTCSSGVGRIFGGYNEHNIFYIVFIDIRGEVHKKAHK